jgi:hypothetical protein
VCVCFLFTVLDPEIEQYNAGSQNEELEEQVCVLFGYVCVHVYVCMRVHVCVCM